MRECVYVCVRACVVRMYHVCVRYSPRLHQMPPGSRRRRRPPRRRRATNCIPTHAQSRRECHQPTPLSSNTPRPQHFVVRGVPACLCTRPQCASPLCEACAHDIVPHTALAVKCGCGSSQPADLTVCRVSGPRRDFRPPLEHCDIEHTASVCRSLSTCTTVIVVTEVRFSRHVVFITKRVRPSNCNSNCKKKSKSARRRARPTLHGFVPGSGPSGSSGDRTPSSKRSTPF